MAKRADIAGLKFGRLTATRIVGVDIKRSVEWLCVCECGSECTVIVTKLRNGNTKSCGCLRVERATTLKDFHEIDHGHTANGVLSPEWMAWRAMRSRCNCPAAKGYQYYGGRGIKVCERWMDFKTFLADVGQRPSPKHSLDRYPDNNGNYEPGNVRWATRKEQDRNKRSNRMVTVRGETMILADAIERFAVVRPGTVSARLSHGWSVEQALFS